jgi:hypothetical protein
MWQALRCLPRRRMLTPMTRILISLLGLCLTACAATPSGGSGPANAPPRQEAPSNAALSAAAFLALAGSANAPTEADVTARFGAPDTARRDGRGVLMTWRLAPCAVIAAFADGRLSVVDMAPQAQKDACLPALEARGKRAE